MAHKNIVGQNLRRKRVELQLSQDQLTTKCNLAGWDLSRGTLAKIEAGLRRVNDAEVVLLATVIGMSTNDLLRCDPEELNRIVRQGRE